LTSRSGSNGPALAVYPEDMAHATKASKSAAQRRRTAQQMRGMFAHLAPGVSMADELIADRRAEVRAEESADADRRSGKS
jgi:ABC-type branched-subunit amino acid transport system substrate-binding protein